MTVYFIRHGETELNRLHIVQGSGMDSDLNNLGQAQSKAFLMLTSTLILTWSSHPALNALTKRYIIFFKEIFPGTKLPISMRFPGESMKEQLPVRKGKWLSWNCCINGEL